MMNAAARSIDHPVMLGSTLVVATVILVFFGVGYVLGRIFL